MKKFILFIFLAALTFARAQAQDDTVDEFADPSLQSPSPQIDVQSNELPAVPLEIPLEPASAPQNVQTSLGDTQSDSETGEVLLERPPDFTASYKQRRSRHGIIFSIDYEKFYPVDYYSQYRDLYIEKIIGTDKIDLIGAELGYKLNFKLGSLSLLANYSQGHIKGNTTAAAKRTLYLNRTGVAANFALDNFFEEPWIVPYGQIGIHQFQIEEDDLALPNSKAATTKISYNYRFGLLFQLNWIEKAIDPNTQFDALRSSGLENTFLDLYMIDHAASSETYGANTTSGGDPDLASGLELGVGLKMEF